MNTEILQFLKQITPEEQQILDGSQAVDTELYTSADMSEDPYIIEADRLLEEGKLIQVRKHTRFVHFPKHSHNFVEMVYMYSGSIRQKINDKEVILHQGELLILNQHATQEIFPAGENDLAVNFIVLPAFFDYSLRMMDQEDNALHDFMIDCLRGEHQTSGYLYFKVADILPVQNLLENLIWTIHNRQPNKRSINQVTMGLLFLQLMNHMDRVETDHVAPQQELMLTVLQYVEEHYRDGELSVLADRLHYNLYWLSREIKRQSGHTFTDMIQHKRLSQAAFLLRTTAISIADIGLAVGYENLSYFHRIFKETYGVTPRQYRIQEQG